MGRVLGSIVLLGMVVLLGACSDEAPLSSAAPTEPAAATTVAVVPATQEPAPTSTVTPTPTTAAVEGTEARRGASQHAVGVVVAVDGDLSEIRAFSLLLPDGATVELVPQAGLLFDGGPLSHVRDHLVSGAPIAAEFHVEAGVAIATSVGDAQ